MFLNDARDSAAAVFAARFFAAEIRGWRGEAPLWQMFWVYGVGVSAMIAAIYALAIYTDHTGLQQVLIFCAAGYSAWILVSVWRCARNTREKYWGLLARLLTVAWAGNVIMVLAFLQLDLLAMYLGH